MYVMVITKKALSPFDDKLFILSDGITTLPHNWEAISDHVIELYPEHRVELMKHILQKKLELKSLIYNFLSWFKFIIFF